jgi:hypothetical protein
LPGPPDLGAGGWEANGSGGFFPPSASTSKDLRNIAVALSGSACSGGSGPEFASFFAMRGRSYSIAGRLTAKITLTPSPRKGANRHRRHGAGMSRKDLRAEIIALPES